MLLRAGLQPRAAGAAMRLVLPLGLDLTAGVALAVDGTALAKAPIGRCTADGCVAVLPVDATALDKLRAGTTLAVIVRGPAGRQISLGLSLKGFSKAFDEAKSKGSKA